MTGLVPQSEAGAGAPEPLPSPPAHGRGSGVDLSSPLRVIEPPVLSVAMPPSCRPELEPGTPASTPVAVIVAEPPTRWTASLPLPSIVEVQAPELSRWSVPEPF